MKCLAKKLEERYRDAAAVASALAPFGTERSRELADHVRRVHEAARPSSKASISGLRELDWEQVLAGEPDEPPDEPDQPSGEPPAALQPPSPRTSPAAGNEATAASESGTAVERTDEPWGPHVGAPVLEIIRAVGRRIGARRGVAVAALGALAFIVLSVWVLRSPADSSTPQGEESTAGAAPEADDASVASDAADPTATTPAPSSTALDAGPPLPDAAVPDAGARPAGRRPPPGRLPDIYNDTYVPSAKRPGHDGR